MSKIPRNTWASWILTLALATECVQHIRHFVSWVAVSVHARLKPGILLIDTWMRGLGEENMGSCHRCGFMALAHLNLKRGINFYPGPLVLGIAKYL
jgi:hypothetical protein